MTIKWEELRCRFERCRNPVWGIYSAPLGCICHPDPVQALCLQHALKAAQNIREFHVVAERIPGYDVKMGGEAG